MPRSSLTCRPACSAGTRRITGVGVAGVGLGLALLAAGCGTQFDLPTERREVRTTAGAGTYQMIKTRAGLAGIWDVLLTPTGELYLVFKATAGNPARVQRYPQELIAPLSASFPGLLNPGAICFGSNKLFVLDQGDTAAARTDLPTLYTADCGPVAGFSRPIADLSKYWHVVEFELNGGPALGGFTDTTFVWVNGVAADALGRVYVSGVEIYCRVDPFDTRIKTLDTQYKIKRYERGPASGSVIGDNWRLDATYQVVEGTGIGSTIDPHGMQWASATGAALYFADTGNHQVQKFADPASPSPSFKIDFGGSGPDSIHLATPVDVAVDSAGSVYVADFGNQRVLRYTPEGEFVQRVDIEKDAYDRLLEAPIAVAADNNQVYVADRDHAEVVRYRRRK